MSFLFPGFLFTLFALAIPVIIHLFNFRRFRTIYFSNVKFLRNIQEETATRNRLKHFLVLLSRLLALAFLIFAFAQPYIKSQASTPQAGVRYASVYIDNSFSMEATGNGKQLLETAKEKAEEIVNAYSVDDKFQLLTNDFEARQQRMVNKEEMLEMIRSVQISSTVRSIKEVTDRQKDILQHSTEDEKNIYLISDFQKNGAAFENDSAYHFTLVPLKGSEERNISVDSLWFSAPVQMAGQQSQLCFTIKNYGSEDIEGGSVTLKINDQIKGIADVNIPAKSSVTDTLQFTVTDASLQNCALSMTDYPITFDDIFYFSYEPVQKIPVLCINGKSENSFITSSYNNSLFLLQQYTASQIDFNNLNQFNIIILNELQSISSGLADALQKKLDEGATVFIIPALDQDRSSVNTFLANNGSAIFGETEEQKRNVVSANTNAEVFAGVFDKLPKNLSLPYADKSFLINAGSRNLEEVILQCADNRPLLARYKTGNGNIYLSAVPFDRSITDLPVQGALFVPFMYRLALISVKDIPLYVIIGKEQWVKIEAGNLSSDQSVSLKNKDNEFIPAMRKTGGNTEINVSVYAKDAGIYTISGNKIAQSLAMNYNRSESDLTFFSAEELKNKYTSKNIAVLDHAKQNLSGVVTQMQQGKPLWRFCVIFALLFLAIEIALIRFMP